MVKTASFSYPSQDRIHQIHTSLWIPAESPKAMVQIIHGLSEHVERYDRFARFLAQNGFLVFGEDHLGHGRTALADDSYGWFAEKNGWGKVLKDVRQLTLLMRERHPRLPCFLFGHSMGSFLARDYLIHWPDGVEGAILSGTGQEPAPLITIGRLFSSLLCRMGKGKKVSPFLTLLSLGAYNHKFAPNRTPVDWISRDESVQDACLSDPLRVSRPTAGLFRDMLTGLTRIGDPGYLARMDPNTPVLLLSGDKDPVGGQGKGVEKVYSRLRAAGCTDVSLRLYHDGRHEMLNELNYRQVQRDILAWLDAKLPC